MLDWDSPTQLFGAMMGKNTEVVYDDGCEPWEVGGRKLQARYSSQDALLVMYKKKRARKG